MDTAVIVAIVIAAVVVLAIIALAVRASRRKKRVQSRFGPEYDRTVEREGSTRRAVRDLDERAETRDRLQLRELTSAERDRYRVEWESVQAAFVDRPGTALQDADRLVSAVMRDRGYPVERFEEQADLLSVDHPQVVEHYRSAHRVHHRSLDGDVSTEDERQAMLHYRTLFDVLMAPDAGGEQRDTRRDDGHVVQTDDRGGVVDVRDDEARDEREPDRVDEDAGGRHLRR